LYELDDTDADGEASAAPEAGPKLKYSDADLLRLVDDECQRSVGFGDGDTGELQRVRIKAQEYRQGKINDLPVMRGRSQAVDTTLGEAVDTVMPDVMEVFFGGDDVVTFQPNGPQDEGQAAEETDAVTHVVFQANEAFRAFHDAIQDALLNRVGLFHWWWDEGDETIGEFEAGGPAEAAAVGMLVQQQRPWAKVETEEGDGGAITLKLSERRGRVCIKAVPSEDFTVAQDTISLRDGTYCALRERVRIQELIQRGIDPALARGLPDASPDLDEVAQVRNESGEDDRAGGAGVDDLRMVEIRTHYLRLDADGDGELEIWRIDTDAEQKVLLQKEQVSQVPFGALTPYLNAHRFYGDGLADKLFEVMRIKTVLLRMMLDSGFFALNQRMEVAEERASEFTISDLLNNAPNVPVRSRTGDAVRPLQAGQLGFDVFSAMEFMSVVAEQRSGVVRNAQGLNPDTLHDTAKGAMALITAAQKRVRMICRVFAETGVKDLFLGVHQMMREYSSPDHAPEQMKVARQWREVRPAEWAQRAAVTVHVGVGSGGKEREEQQQNGALELTRSVVELQGGVEGPFVTAQNLYNRLKAYSRAIGERDADQYWSDPTQAPPAAAQKPDPEMAKAQAELQLKQQESAAQLQVEQQRMQNDMALARAKLAGELQLKREEMRQKLQLQREQAAQELEMRRQIALVQAANPPHSVDQVHVGGEAG